MSRDLGRDVPDVEKLYARDWPWSYRGGGFKDQPIFVTSLVEVKPGIVTLISPPKAVGLQVSNKHEFCSLLGNGASNPEKEG